MSPGRIVKLLAGAVCLLQFLAVRPAFAQAWVPRRGEGNVFISYQQTVARGHLLNNGERASGANAYDLVRNRSTTLDIEYGVTNRIAARLSVPTVSAKYEGRAPHRIGVSGLPTTVDDGNYHGGLQDYRFGVRMNVATRPLVLTPFAEGIFPSRHYESRGHSVIGLDLRALVLGTNVGGLLDGVLFGLYYQAQLSHAIVQEVAGYRPNRSRVDSEVGYYVTPRLAL